MFRNSKSEIPNIVGRAIIFNWTTGAMDSDEDGLISGALYRGSAINLKQQISNLSRNNVVDNRLHGVGMDASLLSDRYGSFTEVNPLYSSCKYLIHY